MLCGQRCKCIDFVACYHVSTLIADSDISPYLNRSFLIRTFYNNNEI